MTFALWNCSARDSNMNMEACTQKFERVFDVQRRHTKQGRFSEFGFEANGQKHYGITIRGWPEISDGSTVTAILSRASNWKTLLGWVNRDSGEVIWPVYGSDFIMSVIAFFVLCCAVWSLNGEGTVVTGNQLAAIYLLCVVLFATSAGLMLRGVRNFRANRMLRELLGD